LRISSLVQPIEFGNPRGIKKTDQNESSGTGGGDSYCGVSGEIAKVGWTRLALGIRPLSGGAPRLRL